ncbi:MAG: amidohydrolase family protein [Gemmatimonadaceae bacterium]
MRATIQTVGIAILLAVTLPGSVVAGQAASRKSQPVIDMHIHAVDVADFGPGPAVCSDNRTIAWNGWDQRKPFDLAESGTCASIMWPAPKDDASLLRETLAAFKRYNVVSAVTSGPVANVDKWRAAAPSRIIPAVSFFSGGYDSNGRPRMRDIAELRRLVQEKRVAVFAEITQQYRGMFPNDPLLEPYFALAEELDIPVGIHMGEGPPGGANVEGYEKYRVALGNPLLLEEVLVRHPRMRVYVMHYGSPFVDDMIALMFSYPQVYVDVAQNNWGFPREHFNSQLKRLVDAGFSRRIMFGSDQMIWPQTIGLAIKTMNDAPFLTDQQKRDILYNNAARFLRLK